MDRAPITSQPLVSNRIATVPNAISLARLAIAGALPFMEDWRLPLLLIGATSDWIDGYIAHRMNARTVVGQVLDPVADKALVLSALVTLLVAGEIHWWQVGIVLVRDLVVLFAASVSVLLREWRALGRMPPSMIGKMATVVIYIWLAATLVEWAQPFHLPAFIAAGACSLWSASDYARRFVQALQLRRLSQS